MTLIELWNVLDKGLPIGNWNTAIPADIRKRSPEFMPEMGAHYVQRKGGCWVIENPDRFRRWAAGSGLWTEAEIQELDPYIVAFLLRD